MNADQALSGTRYATTDAGQMIRKYYFEDFRVGDTREIQGPTVSAEEIVEFATRFDPQYFHTDREAAKHSRFGGLIASGWHTASLAMRMICDLYLLDTATMGSPGIKDLRWVRPVRPGDSLRLRITVVETAPSRSKPDRGSVTHRSEVINQIGDLVMTMDGVGIIARRPGAVAV